MFYEYIGLRYQKNDFATTITSTSKVKKLGLLNLNIAWENMNGFLNQFRCHHRVKQNMQSKQKKQILFGHEGGVTQPLRSLGSEAER